MITIEYKVENAGWAIAKIDNGEKHVEFEVSYLHDSLKELAESAIDLKTKNHKSIIFMGEPGEHRLILTKNAENKIAYELHSYADWFNWNLVSEEEYVLVLKGETTLAKYINQVRTVLATIFSEIGLEKYKQKWINHDFPIREYEKLK